MQTAKTPLTAEQKRNVIWCKKMYNIAAGEIVEIPEWMYLQILNIVPPHYNRKDSFLSSTPARYTSTGRGVYFGGICWGGKWYGFHSTAEQFVANYHKKTFYEKAKNTPQEELFVVVLGAQVFCYSRLNALDVQFKNIVGVPKDDIYEVHAVADWHADNFIDYAQECKGAKKMSVAAFIAQYSK